MIPGAQLNSWQHAASENPQQGIQANVNGQFFTSNGFLLDGTENQSAILGIAVINPNIDSLQDFKVTTSNYDAEFGSASGALIQATTSSGTNQFHGTLFEFLRNNVTNAADPFTLQNPPIRWNQFGGSVGAPIRRNRMFAFFDYQGTRRRTGGSLITTVPTAAERGGDLTGLLGRLHLRRRVCFQLAMRKSVPGADHGGIDNGRAGGDGVQSRYRATADGAGRQAYTQGGQPNIVPVAGPIANLLKDLPDPESRHRRLQ